MNKHLTTRIQDIVKHYLYKECNEENCDAIVNDCNTFLTSLVKNGTIFTSLARTVTDEDGTKLVIDVQETINSWPMIISCELFGNTNNETSAS